MAGKGGGAWKVAYADFVTAMMAFFMVMWLVGQKDDVKEAIATYFQEQIGEIESIEGSTDGAPQPPPGRGHGGKSKKDSPSKEAHDKVARKPRLVTLHSGDRTSVGAIVGFSEDSLELDPEARAELDRIVPKLAGLPQKIEVRGHASRRPIKIEGASRDPWLVSYERGLAVMNYLTEKGIEPHRIRLTQAGVFEPFTIRNESELQAGNSRVEVFLLSELAEDLVGTPQERAARFEDSGVAVRDDAAP